MSDPTRLDLHGVLLNARRASTEDLLNRVTVFRDGMEPEALAIIESELASRGISQNDIAAHDDSLRSEVIWRHDGLAARCSFCHQPAVAQAWAWHRLWRTIPLFPRFLFYCKEHRPRGTGTRRDRQG